MIFQLVFGFFLFLTKSLSLEGLNLNPNTGTYCTSDDQCASNQRCEDFFWIPEFWQWPSRKNLRLPNLPLYPGKCVPNGSYCKDEAHCRKGEKCTASGWPEYGVCRSDLDPTGKYCTSTSDCSWYWMETCSNTGECVK